MMERRRWQRDEAAISDFVGTLLLVAMVVAIGGVLAVVVLGDLGEPAPPSASLSLAAPAPGAATLTLLYRGGEPLDLDDLRISVSRNDSSPASSPREGWTTPDPLRLRPGDRLALPLAPAAAHDERFRVLVIGSVGNAILADLPTRTGGAAVADLGTPTLAAAFSPNGTIADGATPTRLAAQLSHPLGALAIGAVTADLTSLTRAAGAAPLVVPLADDGGEGDEAGGDGVWSASLRLPSSTPLGSYNVTVNVTDIADRLVATQQVPLHVLANGTWGTGGTTAPDGAVVVNGTCYGCTVDGGSRAYQGTRLVVPTSENITRLDLVNWTVDRLHPERLDSDYVLFRIVGGSVGWSAYITLEEHMGLPYATYMRVWNDAAETEYQPRNLTDKVPRLLLDNLTMNLLNPVETEQWVWKAGALDPLALYQNANVTGDPVLIVTYMGHDQSTSNSLTSLETGIYSFDLVVDSR